MNDLSMSRRLPPTQLCHGGQNGCPCKVHPQTTVLPRLGSLGATVSQREGAWDWLVWRGWQDLRKSHVSLTASAVIVHWSPCFKHGVVLISSPAL